MTWHGRLDLAYRRDVVQGAPRTVLHNRHDGPLRVLASLYPESPAICHNVLVHPPGGLVGGDELDVHATLAEGTHALITTPGATRFYRSTGAAATQRLHTVIADGARLEWLPLETLAYSGCIGENAMRFELSAGAEMIGWDILALGLPASNQAFECGRFLQSIELPGRWLERGMIDSRDTRLLDSPLGWAGHRAMCTMWFAAGSELPAARCERIIDAARSALDSVANSGADSAPARIAAGVTAINSATVVVRILASRTEPAMRSAACIWAMWRLAAWDLNATAPRVWRT